MKLFFFFIIVFLSGCSVIKPPLTSEQIKEQTQKVIENIQNKPDWLFPADVCPADIMPSSEKDVLYLSEGCAKDPLGCFQKCKNEDGNACYSLALLIQDQYGREQLESEPLFLRSCKLGIFSGCTNRAAAMFNLEATDSEAVKCSVNTFEKTCDKDDPWGCTMYGLVLAQGTGRPQNLDEALKVLSKSCKFGTDDEACQEAKRLEKQTLELKGGNKKK